MIYFCPRDNRRSDINWEKCLKRGVYEGGENAVFYQRHLNYQVLWSYSSWKPIFVVTVDSEIRILLILAEIRLIFYFGVCAVNEWFICSRKLVKKQDYLTWNFGHIIRHRINNGEAEAAWGIDCLKRDLLPLRSKSNLVIRNKGGREILPKF